MYKSMRISASRVVIAAVLALCIGEPSSAEDQPAPPAEVRESATLYFDKGGRERTSLKARTNDAFDPLVTTGHRQKPGPVAPSGKTSSTTAATKGFNRASNDFWFYYADVQLFGDDDRDGYFYGLDVLFDADTYFEVADVYAVLYLSYEGGPWNEYAVTEPFSIHGATSDDEYVVVTELETGYPTGSYDLLIELYDTYDGAFVADIGPEDDSGLGFLPLEDFNRDNPNRRRHRGGGGAFDWLTAGMLAATLVAAMYRRRRTLR